MSIHQRRKQARAEHFGHTVETVAEVEESDDLSGLTKAELLERAADADIDGRSSMNKDELIEALGG